MREMDGYIRSTKSNFSPSPKFMLLLPPPQSTLHQLLVGPLIHLHSSRSSYARNVHITYGPVLMSCLDAIFDFIKSLLVRLSISHTHTHNTSCIINLLHFPTSSQGELRGLRRTAKPPRINQMFRIYDVQVLNLVLNVAESFLVISCSFYHNTIV